MCKSSGAECCIHADEGRLEDHFIYDVIARRTGFQAILDAAGIDRTDPAAEASRKNKAAGFYALAKDKACAHRTKGAPNEGIKNAIERVLDF